MVKASIVIPTYNRSGYLKESVASVLGQDYENLEVVICDNASNDDTQAVAQKLCEKDKRVKYFRNKENIGLINNWRRGVFEHATGDIVLILCDDDYFTDSTFVSKAVALFEGDPDVSVVFGCMKVHHEKDGIIEERLYNLPRVMSGKWVFDNYWKQISGKTLHLPMVSTFFKRQLAIKCNILNDPGIISGDSEMCMMMAFASKKIGYIPEVVAVYRDHGNDTEAQNKSYRYLIEESRFITNVKEFVVANGMSATEAQKWQRRILNKYYPGLLRLMIERKVRYGTRVPFFSYIKEIYKIKPGYFLRCISPRIILLMLLANNPFLFNSAKRAWRLLKQCGFKVEPNSAVIT